MSLEAVPAFRDEGLGAGNPGIPDASAARTGTPTKAAGRSGSKTRKDTVSAQSNTKALSSEQVAKERHVSQIRRLKLKAIGLALMHEDDRSPNERLLGTADPYWLTDVLPVIVAALELSTDYLTSTPLLAGSIAATQFQSHIRYRDLRAASLGTMRELLPTLRGMLLGLVYVDYAAFDAVFREIARLLETTTTIATYWGSPAVMLTELACRSSRSGAAK